MKTEEEDNQDIINHSDDNYLQKIAKLFKKVHKFQTNTKIEICVYQGAKEFTNQSIPFRQACESIHSTSEIRIVTLTCSDVNTFKLSEEEIIDWLLQGDIHFILTHIHQGIVNINMSTLYSVINKLYDHPGFPAAGKLHCPVFTQDKYKYLSALMPKGMCNPTFKVDFLPVMDYDALKRDLQK